MARRHRKQGFGRTLWEAAAILAIATLLTLVAWLMRSPRLPWLAERQVYEYELDHPLISVETALAHYAGGRHLFVDTRPVDDEAADRISGALFLRPESFDDDFQAVHDFIFPEDSIVLYGDRLQRTAAVAGQLAARGYGELMLLSGDLAAWRAAGGAIEDPGGEP